MEDVRHVGQCDWFATSGQSYGYIKYPLGQIYIHYKNIVDGKRNGNYKILKQGDIVEFDIGEAHYQAGTQAINLKVLKTREEISVGSSVCV